MRCYNILVDNNGSISNLLQLHPFTRGSILLTAKLDALKRVNTESILTVKIIEWRKFIGFYGRSVEADPSRVEKKNIYFACIGYITSPLYVNTHIARQQKIYVRTNQQTKFAFKIVPHIYSALRYLLMGNIFVVVFIGSH